MLNGEPHISYTYDDNVEETIDGTVQDVKKVTTTYANGDTVIAISDLFGNVLDIYEGHYNDDEFIAELHITNDFDNSQRVTEKIDSSINDCVSHNYNYDNKNRITSYLRSATRGNSLPYEEEYSYNAHGNVTERTVNFNSARTDISAYEYNENTQKLKAFTCAGSTRVEPKVDCLGRNRGKTVSWNGTKIYSEDITYLKHGDHATSMPLTISYGNNTEHGFVVKDRIKYKYDEMGNICEAYENGQFVTEYKYDALGRLVRENNKKLGKTFVFSYDNKGNIVTRTEYAFTLKDDDFVKESTGEVFEYVYSGEKLVSYNGEAFAYDDIGNPTTYRGNTLTWRFGRRLTSFVTPTSETIAFDYNAEGKRIKKNNISYIYDSQGRLFAQSNGIEYFYDENSSPIAFAYLGEVYYYKKDLLGNIIEILDTTGTTVVKYTYDAWGNHKVLNSDGTENTNAMFIGNINPIRYRSYYFDTETGLYFLQTRYYDPQIGRFINIDDISYLEPESINGLNLYAYCFNDPVMMIDESGCAPTWWEWLLSGLTLTAGIALCFVPGGQVFGAGLIVAGASGLVSNTMDAFGINGKVATLISSGLSIVAGIALCFTPFAGIGAGLIGQGVGSVAGGYISEALGGSFEFGATIGGIAGSFLGGLAYRGITSYRLSHMSAYKKGVMGEKYVKALYGNKVYKPTTGSNQPDLLFKNGSTLIEVKNVASQSMTRQLNRYLAMNVDKNIIYVRLGTKISSALRNSAYTIKYFPW